MIIYLFSKGQVAITHWNSAQAAMVSMIQSTKYEVWV